MAKPKNTAGTTAPNEVFREEYQLTCEELHGETWLSRVYPMSSAEEATFYYAAMKEHGVNVRGIRLERRKVSDWVAL